jgi:hypothetical protein
LRWAQNSLLNTACGVETGISTIEITGISTIEITGISTIEIPASRPSR